MVEIYFIKLDMGKLLFTILYKKKTNHICRFVDTFSITYAKIYHMIRDHLPLLHYFRFCPL